MANFRLRQSKNTFSRNLITACVVVGGLAIADTTVADDMPTPTIWKQTTISDVVSVTREEIPTGGRLIEFEIKATRTGEGGAPDATGTCYSRAIFDGARYMEGGVCVDTDPDGDQLWSSYANTGANHFIGKITTGTGKYASAWGTVEGSCVVIVPWKQVKCTSELVIHNILE